MRTFLLMILTILLVVNANGQTLFSPVESKLKITKHNDLTDLVCSSSEMAVKFQLNRKITILPQKNIVTIDGQTILITSLKFGGYKIDIPGQNMNSQKLLLETYSKYEQDYFKNELHTELINPNNQWVVIKSKGWFIWYFKVGHVPIQVAKETKIQLFTSTIIGDNILTVNAPIFVDGDFNKAGLIVNEMMENLTISKQ